MILGRSSVAACLAPPVQHPFRAGWLPASRVLVTRRRAAAFPGASIRGATSDGLTEDAPEPLEGSTVQFDLQLPRRRLLVQFKCNVCTTTTQRLVNPEAYKRGTVFVQCAGCESYHQLVDNLGLIEEYDFRKPAAESPVDSAQDDV